MLGMTPACSSADVRKMQELKEEFDIDVKVLGIAGSRKMLLSDAPMDLATWREQYDRCSLLPCCSVVGAAVLEI